MVRVRFAILVSGLLLLLTNQGVVEAGYVSASLAIVQQEPIVLDMDEGSGAASSTPHRQSLPDRIASEVESLLARPMGSLSPGGMNLPTGVNPGQGSPAFALIVATPVADLAMIEWVGAEGRSQLPPPLGTGVFRPPRWIAG